MSRKLSKETLRVVVIAIILYVLVWAAKLNCNRSKEGISILIKLLEK